jgi:hypothetical protein
VYTQTFEKHRQAMKEVKKLTLVKAETLTVIPPVIVNVAPIPIRTALPPTIAVAAPGGPLSAPAAVAITVAIPRW